MVRNSGALSAFLRRELRLHRLFALFHDIRKDPVIPLKNLLGMVFCMPFFGHTSMLAAVREARTMRFREFFDAVHRRDGVKMVASDSTLQRTLRWLAPSSAQRMLCEITRRLGRMGLLSTRLSPQLSTRRLGIVDGTVLGKFSAVCVTLLGKVRVPVAIEPAGGRGNELPVAEKLLPQVVAQLGSHAPQLWLVDGLYFTSGFFSLICNTLHADLLIKCKDSEFREVLRDAAALFDSASSAIERIAFSSNFDSERLCSWTVERTSGEFANFPLQVVRLREFYPKRTRNRHAVSRLTLNERGIAD